MPRELSARHPRLHILKRTTTSQASFDFTQEKPSEQWQPLSQVEDRGTVGDPANI